MSGRQYHISRPPLWFILLLLIITLPVAATPWVLSMLPPERNELHTLMTLYPLYVFAADWFAWICWWPRRIMSWIMICLILLSHLAVGTMAIEVLPNI